LIITKVILQDYGVYRGRNEFDFACTETRPVVLIGGTNGAGKTTLFESITLCLYGRSTMGKRITQKAYERFLARKIHRYLKSATAADHASITVQFMFFHNGREFEYRVVRSWKMEDGSMSEQLDVTKRRSDQDDFRPLDTVEKSHWQSFIEDLIPRGIVSLFFFDGEKIVEIARDGTEDAMIKESFKSLLGIELVEQLNVDLQVNLTRNLTGGSKSLRQDFDKYKAERDEAESGIDRLKTRLAQKQTEMDSLRTEMDVLEGKISRIGGKFSSSRDTDKAKLAEIKSLHEATKRGIVEMCSGVLPFSIMPAEMQRLSEQIQKDESIQQQRVGRRLLESKLKKITAELRTERFWNDAGLDGAVKDKVASAMTEMLGAELTSEPQEEPVFDFSAKQASRIEDIIMRAETVAVQALNDYVTRLDQMTEDMAKIETSIASAPSDDEIGSLISKIREMDSQAGTLRAEMNHIEEKISSNMSLRQHLDVKLRDILSQIYSNEKAEGRVKLTQDVQAVLEEFIEKLRVKKIHLLERYLLDATGTLMRKKNLIKRVKVDPDTFEVTLFRENDDPLPKDLLSEGEKQMFAMAVLWALAKTSGRPLPFMIDTPLARLDEEHRTNIVEKFLPAASHQILVFSTDKEIENRDYQRLGPYLARSYAMEYLDGEGATKKHDGYFWNTEGEKIVAVQ